MRFKSWGTLILLCFFIVACHKQQGNSTTVASKPGPTPVEGWVSSGGELLKDAHNPWWIKNTLEVAYCIQIDTSAISAKPEKITELVERALKYWQKEFTTKLSYTNSPEAFDYWNDLGIGTQKFTLKDCASPDVKLRFQFGYSTLSKDQLRHVSEPKRYVAFPLRTYYNPVTLQGEGIILIASDQGPDKFPMEPKALPAPWSNESILFRVILHELGHVFGIPDMGPDWTLMSRRYPELLVSFYNMPSMYKPSVSETEIESFFFPPDEFLQCTTANPHTKEFFNITGEDKIHCVFFDLDESEKEMEVTQKHYRDSEGIWKMDNSDMPLGTLKDLQLSPTHYSGVSLHLTNAQKVFDVPPISGDLEGFAVKTGPRVVTFRGSAVFVSTDGKSKPVFLDLRPTTWSLKIYGLVGERLYDLFNPLNTPEWTE